MCDPFSEPIGKKSIQLVGLALAIGDVALGLIGSTAAYPRPVRPARVGPSLVLFLKPVEVGPWPSRGCR
jgi:hypothetical protein